MNQLMISTNAPILTAAQMRAVDAATIRDEPIASVDLMERAALACVDWLMAHMPDNTHYRIFCGLGNNGGDGLAITRLLLARGQTAHAYLIDHSAGNGDSAMSVDAAINWQRLQTLTTQTLATQRNTAIERIQHIDDMPDPCAFTEGDCLIDALLGTGTMRAAEGLLAQVIERLNAYKAPQLIAIDLPSGLLSDAHTPANWPVVHATHTLTFECVKPALLWPENGERVGDWQILPIGLSQYAIVAQHSTMQLVTADWVQQVNTQRTARNKFAHKGTFGHALLIAGAHGTIGAAILAARACLRSGVGLLTIRSPNCGYTSLQTAVPEAMVQTDVHERVWSEAADEAINLMAYDAIGVGCGIGQSAETRHALRAFLHSLAKQPKPLVLDADALNILASEPDLFELLPANTVLTPHPKEFERLLAHLSLDTATDKLRLRAQLILAQKYRVIVVLKGAHTCVALPDGRSFYNTTGNAGMAKGGSGDALTGVILALLAQGYAPEMAAILGVYLHGAAGDVAARKFGQTAMLPSDLIECLGII